MGDYLHVRGKGSKEFLEIMFFLMWKSAHPSLGNIRE